MISIIACINEINGKNINANSVMFENATSEIIDNEVEVLNVLNDTPTECE